MKLNSQLSYFALVSSLWYASVSPVAAQDNAGTAPPEADASAPSDIIVTARRTEERLQDVPISITVLNQQDISKRNIVSSVDLGNYVPSLSTNNRFGPEKASFAIRGFTQSTKTAPSVGVYFADVIAPRGNSSTGGGNGAGVGSFMDLQNVQVLKGPQGTLFGRNTTGGAILLVPTKPTDRLEGYVEGSVGDYDLRRVEAVLNVPINDTFRVRAAIDRNVREGYLINHGVGPSRLGNTNYIAARLSVVADLTPDLENYTIATYSRSDTYGTTDRITTLNPNATGIGAFIYPFALAQVNRQNARGDGFWDIENNLQHPRALFTTWQIINTTTWKATDNLTVKNIASYGEFRERSAFSLSGDNFLNPVTAAPFFSYIGLYPGKSGLGTAESTLTEEFQLQGQTSDSRFTWQTGAYLEVSNPLKFNTNYSAIFLNCTDGANLQCTNPLGFGFVNTPASKDYFNDKGFYGQGTYKLTDKLSLTGGIRYTIDHMRTIAENTNIRIAPVTLVRTTTCQNPLLGSAPVLSQQQCHVEFRENSRRPTWLIDADYKPTGDILFYAKWARGYRAGAINSNNIQLEISQPEKVDSYEGGAKASFRGPVPGFVNVAGFYNTLTNQQLPVNAVATAAGTAAGLAASQPILNAGKSRIWGIEIDGSLTPFTGLRVDVGYAYLNTKLIALNIPPSPTLNGVALFNLYPTAVVGGPLALSPKNRYTISPVYTLPISHDIGDISLGATFTHTDSNAAVSPQASPLYLIKASNLLDVNATWRSVLNSPIDLSFFMTNVTNEKRLLYPIASISLGFDGGTTNLPRMFGFRARYTFGR